MTLSLRRVVLTPGETGLACDRAVWLAVDHGEPYPVAVATVWEDAPSYMAPHSIEYLEVMEFQRVPGVAAGFMRLLLERYGALTFNRTRRGGAVQRVRADPAGGFVIEHIDLRAAGDNG